MPTTRDALHSQVTRGQQAQKGQHVSHFCHKTGHGIAGERPSRRSV